MYGGGGSYNEMARSAGWALGKEGGLLQRHSPAEMVAGRAPAKSSILQGFIRVSAAGAMQWERLSFVKGLLGVWSAFWVILKEMAWRPFDLEQVFIRVERFPVKVFFENSDPLDYDFDP